MNKPIPKYRLNYLMKRIKEVADEKIRDINVRTGQAIQDLQDHTEMQKEEQFPGYNNILELIAHYADDTVIANRPTQLRRHLRKWNASRANHRRLWHRSEDQIDMTDLQATLQSALGYADPIRKLDELADTTRRAIIADGQKSTQAVHQYVRDLEDKHYLGKFVDLRAELKNFIARKF